MLQVLKRHPDSPSGAVTKVEVGVARPEPDRLMLTYTISGAIDAVRLPPVTEPARADELWQHTCLEAFVRPLPGEAYAEFNFAPSTLWAAYRFKSYRKGMTPDEDMAAPRLSVETPPDQFILRVALIVDSDSGLRRDAHWKLGLSAVIEESSRQKSYWALAHPPGRPDFHHADCFALNLPPASRV